MWEFTNYQNFAISKKSITFARRNPQYRLVRIFLFFLIKTQVRKWKKYHITPLKE